MAYAVGGNFEKAVKLALSSDLIEVAKQYIHKATVLVKGDESK
jgi:putative transposon-encoded protein